MLQASENLEAGLKREPLSNQAQRLLKGQFYTPSPVCDLMLSLAGLSAVQRMLEPGCGEGAFLLRAHARLRHQANASMLNNAGANLHGIELDAVAYEAVQQRLQAAFPDAPIALCNADFISPAADLLGLFDVVVGNPPYVRQEHVKQSRQMDKKAAHAYLLEKYADYLALAPSQRVLFAQTSDLYIWFFLQAASLLKPGGRLVFITSNSWLNASFGEAFRQFLTAHFHVRALAESTCERWFTDAAVNPLIVALDKKDLKAPPDEGVLPVKILRFQSPLTEWLPREDMDSPAYWTALDGKLGALLQGNNTALQTEVAVKTIQPTQLIAQPMDEVHYFLQNAPMAEIKLKSSMDEVKFSAVQPERTALPGRLPARNHCVSTAKQWAFIMRAPDVLMRLLEDPAEWLRLDALGAIRYPLKTGINRFFYLSRAQAQQWEIEPEFLLPVVKSLRGVQGYFIQPEACETLLFSCGFTQEDLALRKQTGALRYIQWGETQLAKPRQKRGQPVPWPQVASVQHHRPWYYVRPLPPAHVLCSRFYDQRFFFPQCKGNVLEDQTFYGLTLNNASSPILVAGLLNSTLSLVLLEFTARNNLGEGVLQFARCDMASFPIINPAIYTPEEQQRIEAGFLQMAKRAAQNIKDEVFNPDRAALDEAVLTPLFKRVFPEEPFETIRGQIIEGLLTKMNERRRMARSC